MRKKCRVNWTEGKSLDLDQISFSETREKGHCCLETDAHV